MEIYYHKKVKMKSEIREKFYIIFKFEFGLWTLCKSHFSFFVFDHLKVTSLSNFGSQKNQKWKAKMNILMMIISKFGSETWFLISIFHFWPPIINGLSSSNTAAIFVWQQLRANALLMTSFKQDSIPSRLVHQNTVHTSVVMTSSKGFL